MYYYYDSTRIFITLTGVSAEEVKIKDGGRRLAPRPGPVSQESPPRAAQMTDLSWAPTPAGGSQAEAAASQSKHTCMPLRWRHGTDSHVAGGEPPAFVSLKKC
ncbi:hypothetical protein SKAU_G00357700 [Synaphobranchus kaupii]|uniref:Uncharacterized protein n=1 Tax=Synaphobranchus kaupii TaxID=118154 RepID=A0A9Q1IGS4_SYNKA|nr:hypothetical protein SKAU_G00357700 [Synaphobranchus kaupii]